MSKGKWVLGKRNPKITLLMQVLRGDRPHKCCHCSEEIKEGDIFIKLSAPYYEGKDKKKPRFYDGNHSHACWYFCFTKLCLQQWAEAKMQRQGKEIEEKRGYDPFERLPYSTSRGRKYVNISKRERETLKKAANAMGRQLTIP